LAGRVAGAMALHSRSKPCSLQCESSPAASAYRPFELYTCKRSRAHGRYNCGTRDSLRTLRAVRLCRVVWSNESQHLPLVKFRIGQMSMNGSKHGSAYTQTENAQDNGRRRASPLRSPSFQGHDPVSLRRIEAEVNQHVARSYLTCRTVCHIDVSTERGLAALASAVISFRRLTNDCDYRPAGQVHPTLAWRQEADVDIQQLWLALCVSAPRRACIRLARSDGAPLGQHSSTAAQIVAFMHADRKYIMCCILAVQVLLRRHQSAEGTEAERVRCLAFVLQWSGPWQPAVWQSGT
jgi:hypothetical protein